MADYDASGALQSSNATVSGTTLPHFEMAEGAATPGSTTQRLSGLTGTFGNGRIEEADNPSGNNDRCSRRWKQRRCLEYPGYRR